MRLFSVFKPRTAKGNIRQRELDLMAKLEKLMDADDEHTFREGLEKEFGLKPGHPKYETAMSTWRDR